MNYLVTLAGTELYRCSAPPVLRPGEACFALDPNEPEADLLARIAAGQTHTLATLVAARCAEVEAERDRRLAAYRHDFGAEHGVLTLQLRNLDDRTNWLTLDGAAAKIVAAGDTTTLLPLRTAENITLLLLAADAAAVLSAMAYYGQLVMAASWDHKDNLRALADMGAVAAYDIGTGWPQ